MDLPGPRFDDGNLRVDLASREVILDSESLRLSRKEFALLQILISHPGRILTQQYLLAEIWGKGHQEDSHYLRILVGKLRAKLNDDPDEPRYIQTETGVGYRFMSTPE